MTFRIVQNDTAPPITSRLSDDNGPINLGNASNVEFHLQDEFDRVVVSDDLTGRVEIIDNILGEVKYEFSPNDTTDVGTYKGEWQVLYDNGKIETFPVSGYIDVEIKEQIE